MSKKTLRNSGLRRFISKGVLFFLKKSSPRWYNDESTYVSPNWGDIAGPIIRRNDWPSLGLGDVYAIVDPNDSSRMYTVRFVSQTDVLDHRLRVASELSIRHTGPGFFESRSFIKTKNIPASGKFKDKTSSVVIQEHFKKEDITFPKYYPQELFQNALFKNIVDVLTYE